MNIRHKLKKDLIQLVKENLVVDLFIDIEVSRTKDPKFGDFSSNVALQAFKQLKTDREGVYVRNQPARAATSVEMAEKIKDLVDQNLNDYIEKVEVAGPGFVNFFVKDNFWQNQVGEITSQKEKYGSNDNFKGKKARVEFVSANPTGPLHFGNARGGPIGDALASVLTSNGYDVLREYLHNDIGGQVVKLGQTIANVAKGENLQDQQYKGEYVKELVEKIGNFETPQQAGKLAVDMMLDETLDDCAQLNIKFDKVFPESGFVQSRDTERSIEDLDKKGFIKEKDGAKWFAPNDEFLKDRETVVVKSDGDYTYFSNDIAYHKIKFSEGYDLVVDVFGANHHGHVPRLQAVVKAFGYDVSKFHVILYQWVRFKKGGQILAMSKRSGNFITAREVLEMVGADAVRFFILMHDANSHIDFDLDLAKEKSNKNPVFYVQYAHARISSILEKADAKDGFLTDLPSETLVKDGGQDDFLSKLTTPYELALIKKLTELPELVEEVAISFAVNRLTTYATELADVFHKFYEHCHVIGEEKELESARLQLLKATQITLANTLHLLGISAPEKM